MFKQYPFRQRLSIVFTAAAISFTAVSVKAENILKVGYLPILDHLPLLVSQTQDNKKFKAIHIDHTMFKSWPSLSGALKAGVIDAAFILTPMAMDLFNNGAPIQTILLAHRDGSAITVAKDSAITSAKDLKGQAIAIPAQNATHTALLDKYLRGADLSLKDVDTRVIAPMLMIEAMRRNIISAFIVAEPFGSKAQNEGVGKVLVLTKDIEKHHIDCIVVVKQAVLQTNSEGIQEWVNSLLRAGKFIEKDKQENGGKETAELVAPYFPHSAEAIIGGMQNPPDRISFADLNPKREDFQTILDISKQAGIIGEVDLDKFIEPKFYENSPEK